MMNKVYGIMVMQNTDGTTSSSRIKSYNTYDEMVADKNAGKYGIVLATNTVYHNTDKGWIVGFPNVVRDDDYTAFEVFAHDYDIPVGDCAELGGYVNFALPKQMTHKFGLRSQESQDKQNVVIDWGDGTTIRLSDITPSNNYYYVQHTYAKTGKYIVRIYGNTYFAIAQSPAFAYSEPNILCRVFDFDLPVASHLGNLSSFCINSNHLINVKVPAAFNWSNVKNFSSTFWECKNLLSATGFPICNKFNFQESAIFRGCVSLKETDFSFIHVCYGGWSRAFYGCNNLEVDINDLLYYPFSTKDEKIDITSLFYNCSKLKGTVPADKLWNNKEIVWSWGKDSNGNPYYPFEGCSDEIREQVPVSWGGTASDDIIEKSLEEKYDEITSRLDKLEASE